MNYSKTIKENASALMVTYGSMLFEGAILTLLIALMSPLSIRYNVSTATISTLLTAQAVGNVSSVYFSGNASDKIGKKKMILFGLLFYFVFLIGMSITSNFYVALFLALLAGIGHGFMDSPSISMLIDIFGDHSGPSMSIVAVFFSGGGALSSIIVSRLLHFNLDFRIIFIIYFFLAVIVGIITYKAKYPKRQVRKVSKKDSKQSLEHRKILLKTAAFLGLLTFLIGASNAIFRTWVSTYAVSVGGLTLESSLNLLTFLQIGSVIGAVFFAYILTKVHSTKIMIINGFIAITSLVLFLTIDISGISGVLLVMVAGAVLSIGFSLSLNIVGELFIENSGQATGFVGTSHMTASIVMTFLTSRLLTKVGVSFIIWIAVGLSVVATLLSISFRVMFVKVRKEVIDQN